ncbi:O-acyltransferase like protein-like [Melitaea cinxia]|uniref:O-acyltransferase like protein-like n=1 Tax=Melitaea cinxia TaxID=113334 RepID=UPI001E26F696|nr:O-acyltransferase like protein-like [Melitaea cinxia]
MNLFKNVLVVFGSILYVTSARLVIDENTPKRLFDEDLYRSVIDRDECRRQVDYLKRTDSTLLAQFLDAGVRLPRGLFTLNNADLGNYEQCLGIISENGDMKIEGKYYLIRVPFDQEFKLPFDTPSNFNVTNGKIIRVSKFFNEIQEFAIRTDAEESDPDSIQSLSVLVSVCVPKPCTTQDWITNMLFNISAFGFKYDEVVVRLPDDKPWVPADYVAIAIFSLLGFITLVSTSYDIIHTNIQRKDPKKANVYLRSFSVYTNTRRLVTFTPNANALDCLDGIRSLSMIWVIIGHVFQMDNVTSNMSDVLEWLTSAGAIWVTTAHNAVDSFLLMAGILLTYTTVGKMTGGRFLKRLHVFYFNRLLRMFPLLAALVLLEASVFHRVADGPYWEEVANGVQNCRSFWWTTLLHVQNFVNPDHLCVRHSWYIAIDIQLHIVSPIILYWVLGKSRKAAWIALLAGFLAMLTTATVWNFIRNSASTSISLLDADVQTYYFHNFYYLPWTRAAPFFLGMIVGYGFVVTSWLISLGLIASNFYVAYATMQFDWDNQMADNFINSFMKLIWSVGLSWIIFACVKGYGGPINWFLTLSMWKLPARISFAMYLYHYPLTFIISGTILTPSHFSVGSRIYEFMSVFTLSFFIAFLMTVVIDAPFSVLTKILMEGGQKRPRQPQDGVSSQSIAVPKKNIMDLEGTIATNLEKIEPINEHLVKNSVNFDTNEIPNKTDKHGEFLSSNVESEKL